jgi:hypothetical protein
MVKILINGWRFVLSIRGSVSDSNALLIVVGAIIISDKEHCMPQVKKIVKSILNDHQNNLDKNEASTIFESILFVLDPFALITL